MKMTVATQDELRAALAAIRSLRACGLAAVITFDIESVSLTNNWRVIDTISSNLHDWNKTKQSKLDQRYLLGTTGPYKRIHITIGTGTDAEH